MPRIFMATSHSLILAGFHLRFLKNVPRTIFSGVPQKLINVENSINHRLNIYTGIKFKLAIITVFSIKNIFFYLVQ